MEEIISHLQELLTLPDLLVNKCTFLPESVRLTLIECIKFIPILYFLYYGIELLERFFLKNIHIFIRFLRTLGPIFGVLISTIPECGYQVIVSTFYTRKMITRGTLLAFYISCSDDALPLLFMDLSKAIYILPLVIIKVIVGLVVAYSVDLIYLFKKKEIEDINAINIDLNEPGCCHHKISTMAHPPYWYMHPLSHTFNMFMFTLLSLLFINCTIAGFGGAEQLASFTLIDTPYQLVATAIFGLIPNCVVSIFLALLFVKGIIGFPALLSGLTTVTGLGLAALLKRSQNNVDYTLISIILLIVGIVTGLFAYYNMDIVEFLKFGLTVN